MPDLVDLLRSQDLGHIRIVADLWGLDVQLRDVDSGAEAAAGAMLDARLVQEIVEALDPGARAALNALIESGGRMPWTAFARRFGEVREMGAGRRDRDKPHLQPASPAEVLFYRSLLGRAFFDTPNGPQELAYIPGDLLHILGRSGPSALPTEPPGRPAAPAEHAHVRNATDRVLDDATTFLAAVRTGHAMPPDPVLSGLLEAAGILKNGQPQARNVRSLLEMPRSQALSLLVDAWRRSETFDELRLVPGLVCEGTWVGRPRATREFILNQVAAVPQGTWWNLPALIGHIKEKQSDFQRPAGDYDSWFIRRTSDGSYLRGFSSWDEVDGALLRFMLTGVMERLGLLELAAPGPEHAPTAFRRVSTLVITGNEEDGKLHASAQGRIAAGPRVPRAVRYQLARFCEWEEPKAGEHRYHITPASLTLANSQGLKVEHLLALLAKYAEAGAPPVLVKALKRWESSGTEARAEAQTVLRVSKPAILDELRRSKAAKYLGQSLGPTSVIVKDGAIRKVADIMTEMGYLLEDKTGTLS